RHFYYRPPSFVLAFPKQPPTILYLDKISGFYRLEETLKDPTKATARGAEQHRTGCRSKSEGEAGLEAPGADKRATRPEFRRG
ncbi:MAG: hypothetical protein ACPIOQ_53125, partial [Promethearchaeia archaeon]